MARETAAEEEEDDTLPILSGILDNDDSGEVGRLFNGTFCLALGEGNTVSFPAVDLIPLLPILAERNTDRD